MDSRKKGAARAVAVAALLLVLAGCASTQKPRAESSAPSAKHTPSVTPSAAPSESDPPTGQPFQVSISVDPVLSAAGSLEVTATSNLPDGAELLGWLSSDGFQAQDKEVLSGGRVQFAPFSDHGARLPSGTYQLSVSMSVARLQSPAVRKYIGEKGELMTGPLVKPGTVETDQLSVDYETTVTVP